MKKVFSLLSLLITAQIVFGQNIGAGLSDPVNKMDISAGDRTGTHPSGLPFYVTGNILADTSGIEFRQLSGLQGIGFGYNTIYATGLNADQDLGMLARGVGGNLRFSTSDSERMRIQGNGNVGIGWFTGGNKLDISNSARTGSHASGRSLYVTGNLSPSSNGIEFRTNDGTQGIGFGSNTIYAAGSNANQDLGLSSKGTGLVKLSINGLEFMRITPTGIGISAVLPNDPLEVGGSGRAFFGNGAGPARIGLLIDGIEGTDAARIEAYNHQNATGRHLIINTIGKGNVGIGTATPHAPLQFENTVANRKIVLWEEVNNNHEYYGFGINGGILRYQVADTANDHVFYAAISSSGSDELMRIRGNGNVAVAGSIENEGWTEPSYGVNFQWGGGLTADASFYKDKEGRVHLRGYIRKNDGSDDVVFALPDGYIPSADEYFGVPWVYDSERGSEVVIVFNTGVVQIDGPEGYYSLSGISFRAEQ